MVRSSVFVVLLIAICERCEIQAQLYTNASMGEIARKLDRSVSSITKEISRNRRDDRYRSTPTSVGRPRGSGSLRPLPLAFRACPLPLGLGVDGCTVVTASGHIAGRRRRSIRL
ncbi:hypothetical protein EG835_00050 [bacterium]|nr:hypothetical protein [bacterium]